MRQKADTRIGIEDLLPGGGQRADQHPGGGNDGDPGKTVALHLEQDTRAENQRNAGQHLIGDAEQRPQGIDSSQRIDHTLIQEITPAGDANRGCDQAGDQRIGALHRRDEGAEQILQHEASGPRARIDRRQDEKRLEQNGEVIPERHHGFASRKLRQDLRHAHRQRRRAAGTGNDGVLAHIPSRSA